MSKQKKEAKRAQPKADREPEFIWSTIGKTLVSSQELDIVLSQVIQLLSERVRVETGSVLLRDPDTDDIDFAKILHGTTEQFATMRLKVGQGIVGRVIESGRSIIVNDVTRDPRWFSKIDTETGFVTRSILCVPLVVKNQVIGAIELLNKQGGKFNSLDQDLLESIAAPIAIAVQNARLHQRMLDQLSAMTQLFHRVENAKREWETTVDALDEGIFLVDDRGCILRANNTLANWLQTAPVNLTGKMCCQVIHGTESPPPECPHAKFMAVQAQTQGDEFEERNLGGVFRITCFPLPEQIDAVKTTVVVLKNVTEEKRMQAQLIQSEKMVATGRLAASLAHEINNPLQAIKGSLYLAQMDMESPKTQLEHLTTANAELDRIAILVQQVLGFSRSSLDPPSKIDVQQLFRHALSLCGQHLENSRITVETEWTHPIPGILGIGNQLTQVFLNLIINAIEAMPEGGRLRVIGNLNLDDGTWFRIDLVDSGIGISPENLSKVFDPFFTTKENGTGLGLGICRTIVMNHGGKLTVNSAPRNGSTFSVWLPVEVAEGKPSSDQET